LSAPSCTTGVAASPCRPPFAAYAAASLHPSKLRGTLSPTVQLLGLRLCLLVSQITSSHSQVLKGSAVMGRLGRWADVHLVYKRHPSTLEHYPVNMLRNLANQLVRPACLRISVGVGVRLRCLCNPQPGFAGAHQVDVRAGLRSTHQRARTGEVPCIMLTRTSLRGEWSELANTAWRACAATGVSRSVSGDARRVPTEEGGFVPHPRAPPPPQSYRGLREWSRRW
jgi:hypothetical protein